MRKQTYGFGVDPAQSVNHFFVLITPKEPTAASPPTVQVYERFLWTAEGEQVLDAADKLRIEISKHKWGEVKAALTAEFNFRLKKDGLKISKFPAVGGTPVERLFGKEMMVLLWAIEDCDPSVISTAVRNWKGLMPEERWWLYTMTNAATGELKDRKGWRTALRYALCENPVVERSQLTSLKVLTSYNSIGEIDLDYELDLAIHEPSRSKVVALIERAKKQAYDCIIPAGFDNFLWKDLSPAERFYIKGLESEKNGNYQISTYQEYARGFAITSYSQLMANERANTCRLKTPTEFAMRTVGDVPGFEESVLRLVLAAIHISLKEDEQPDKGLWHIKNNLADYWGSRDMVKQLLAFLKDTQNIANMPHWSESAQMAGHLYVLVDNDHI